MLLVAQHLKPPPVMLALHTGVLVEVPSAPLPMLLPANTLGKAANDDKHMDPCTRHESQMQPGPALGWLRNLSLLHSVTLPSK